MQIETQRINDAEHWMVQYLADLLDIPPSDVDVTRSFDQFGLDSAATVAFTSDMSRWLGIKLDTRIMIENETIRSVAAHIQSSYGKGAVA